MSEVSNLADYGITDPWRERIVSSIRGLVEAFTEIYEPSKQLVKRSEFGRLGLTDSAWLAVLDDAATLVTVDLDLYLEAQRQGKQAVNFHHVRLSNGLI